MGRFRFEKKAETSALYFTKQRLTAIICFSPLTPISLDPLLQLIQ